jgi:predicted outer membrane repeat protein
MATLFNPFFQVVDGDGAPIAGAKLYFYVTGTSTPQHTYAQSDLDAGSVNTNPVVADADGRFGPIYLGTTDYKVILKDASDVTIETLDPLLVATTSTITTEGDLIIGNSDDAPSRLPIGVADRVLLSSGTTASWEQISLTDSGVLTGILPKSRGGAGSAIAAPVSASYATHTYDSGATIVPYDDTIPQSSEGIELFSQAFTATTAANRVRVRCVANLGSSGAAVTCMSLFIDAAAGAVRSSFNRIATGDPEVTILEYEAAVSAGAHTYKIRIGSNTGPIAVNGNSAGRIGGGVQAAKLTIEELPTT